MDKTLAKPVDQAVQFLRDKCKAVPAAAIVLGSGVNVLENLDEEQSFPYQDVFGMSPGVVGHSGSLCYGKVAGVPVVVLRGRFHAYEGHNWDVVTLVAKTMIAWGVPRLYLTNAAGGLNRSFKVGDLMVLTGYRDHLNPRWQEAGLLPALAAATTSCDNDATRHLIAVGEKLASTDKSFRPLQKGVYSGLLGPAYETLAEVEMLRRLQVDAVGMSTVPEMQTANGTGTMAAALSVVTNVWTDEPIGGHEEVLEAAKEASARLDKLFRAAISS